MAYVNIPTLTDWQYDESIKKLKHNTGTARVTVLALYSALMDLADNSDFMDSDPPMEAQTPVEFSVINGWEFSADSDLGYLYGGSVVVEKAGADKDVWANFYTLGTVESDVVVYWLQNGSLVASHPGYASGHIDQLIKVISAGAAIDSRNILAYARNRASGNADLYDHFPAQASTTGGRNPVPLATSPDANDDGSDVSAYTITVAFGTANEDVNGDGTAEAYDVTVDCGGAYTCLQAYRFLKHITRRENTAAVGSGTSTQGRFYTRANGAYSEVKPAPFGTFAGGKFFGARGILLKGVTDSNNRQLIDAAGNTRIPPVTITVSVTGVVSGDRLLVARAASGVINKSQFTLSGTHTAATTVTATEAVGNDIPSSGTLRFGDALHTYSGINRGAKQFTGVSPSVTGAGGTPFYNPLIDQNASGTSAAVSITYASDFEVSARVRKKGIKPFANSGTVGNSGLTISAIRTTDTIVV